MAKAVKQYEYEQQWLSHKLEREVQQSYQIKAAIERIRPVMHTYHSGFKPFNFVGSNSDEKESIF